MALRYPGDRPDATSQAEHTAATAWSAWSLPAAARTLLALLVATDVLLLALNVLHLATPYFADERYSVAADRGFAEVVQYLKLYWTAFGFAWLGLRTREGAYAAWVPVFGYLLLDDAFSLHERAGLALRAPLGLHPAFGLRARDFGELAVLGLAAAGALLLVGVAYRWGSVAFRRLSQQTVAGLALLAAFAVGLDLVHSLARHGPPALELTLGVLEDGGEMLVVSVLCAAVLARLLSSTRPDQSSA